MSYGLYGSISIFSNTRATRDKKAQGGTVSVIVVNEPGEAIIESISNDRLAQIMREGHQ